MSTNKNQLVIFLSRDLGVNGAGISASDYLQFFNNHGIETKIIYQVGNLPFDYRGPSKKLKLDIFTKLYMRIEKRLFSRYPTNPSRELISLGFAFWNQRKITREIRNSLINYKKVVVYVHWVNLGFTSIRTLTKLARHPNLEIVWHLHDLWIFQDLFHTPNVYRGKFDFIKSWDLDGHPNVIQSIAMRKSRKNKKNLRKNLTYISSSAQLKSWLVNSNNYSRKVNMTDIEVVGQPLISLFNIEKSVNINNSSDTSFPYFLIPGSHLLTDVRFNYLKTISSFMQSGLSSKFRLVVISSANLSDVIALEKLGVDCINLTSRENYFKIIKEATGVICPSLFETFGLTTLEAIYLNRNVGIQSGTHQERIYKDEIKLDIFSGDWNLSETWEDFYESIISNKQKGRNRKAIKSYAASVSFPNFVIREM